MHAQVPDIRFCQDGTDHIGQGSDSQLQGGAVFDKGHEYLRHLDLLRRGLRDRRLRKGRMLSLNNIVYVGDMDTLVKPAQNVGQVLIDFQNDDIRLLDDSLGNAGTAGQVKKTVPVHRRHAHHGDIDRQEMPVIGLQIPEDHGDIIAQSPVTQLSFIGRAMPAVVAEMLPLRIRLHCHDRSKAQVSPDLYIIELIPASGQRSIQERGKAYICPVVNPVPALYDPDSFFRCPAFFLIFCIKIHICPDASC